MGATAAQGTEKQRASELEEQRRFLDCVKGVGWADKRAAPLNKFENHCSRSLR